MADRAPGLEIPATLQAAGDRGARSDELALEVVDRATRHQFSRLRANLLEALYLGPGLRVLEIGAESGVLARHAADAGADVVALEPSPVLAAAARVRSEGAAGSMEVVETDVEGFQDAEGFDVVLAVDVLDDGGADPELQLRRLRELTRPGGVLVVAVDNPLGLRYLLGYHEDAKGREPWAAVPGGGAFHRRPLAAALHSAGFGAQRWLFAHPDHRLAKVVLDERAYGGAGGADLVDQLVRWPCSREPGAPLRLCDDRIAHRQFVEAGLAPEVAGSFVVLCAAEQSSLDQLADPHTVAWSFTGDRLARFAAAKTFSEDSSRPVASRPLSGDGGAAANGWLAQQRPSAQPRVVGRTVEQLFLDACGEGTEAVAAVLVRWRDHLRASETEDAAEAPARDGGEGGHAPHPFRSRRSPRFLPSDHLDVLLANFVVDGAGALHYIDDEWRAPSPVDADLVCARALWWLAADVVTRGVIHPWPASLSVDELTEAFTWACAMGGVVDLDLLKASEAALQSAVSGLPLDHWRASLALLGRLSQTDPGVSRQLPFTSLRTTVSGMTGKARGLEAELATVRQSAQDLQAHLDQARAELERERDRASTARRDADSALAAQVLAQQDDHDRQVEQQRNLEKELREEVGSLTGELSVLRRSWLFPVYQRLADRRLALRRRSGPTRSRTWRHGPAELPPPHQPPVVVPPGVGDPLAARFDEVGPWYTQFVIDGRTYGGRNTYANDVRVPRFFEWAGTWPRILELGSFEGKHTLELAAREGVEEVVGLEGREANLRRARLLLEVLPNPKISLHLVDLTADDSRLEAFLPTDAVFCAGVLYHLAEPWMLLRRLATGTPRLFLDTHYAAVAETEVQGYGGRWYDEGGLVDPLSGLDERSFWPTADELVRMCHDCGFVERRRLEFADWGGLGPRIWLYLERED